MSKEDMRRARMLFTPMTLIVDTNGDVKKVWPGLWKKGFDLSE
jgi:peroxiredoxin